MTTIVASGRGYNVLVDGKVVGFVVRGRRQRDPSRRIRPAKGWLYNTAGTGGWRFRRQGAVEAVVEVYQHLRTGSR